MKHDDVLLHYYLPKPVTVTGQYSEATLRKLNLWSDVAMTSLDFLPNGAYYSLRCIQILLAHHPFIPHIAQRIEQAKLVQAEQREQKENKFLNNVLIRNTTGIVEQQPIKCSAGLIIRHAHVPILKSVPCKIVETDCSLWVTHGKSSKTLTQ